MKESYNKFAKFNSLYFLNSAGCNIRSCYKTELQWKQKFYILLFSLLFRLKLSLNDTLRWKLYSTAVVSPVASLNHLQKCSPLHFWPWRHTAPAHPLLLICLQPAQPIMLNTHYNKQVISHKTSHAVYHTWSKDNDDHHALLLSGSCTHLWFVPQFVMILLVSAALAVQIVYMLCVYNLSTVLEWFVLCLNAPVFHVNQYLHAGMWNIMSNFYTHLSTATFFL